MDRLVIFLLFLSSLLTGFSQGSDLDGKWFVQKKEAPSDLDIPLKLFLAKDSATFNSYSMVDSMYCSEHFIFEQDASFYCTGECHAYDPKNNWFTYYGSYGSWKLINASTLQLDYVHGYSITHCTFRIRKHRHGLLLKRLKMETVAISDEYQEQ